MWTAAGEAEDSHPPLLCSQDQQQKKEPINNSVKSIFSFPGLKATDSVLLMIYDVNI